MGPEGPLVLQPSGVVIDPRRRVVHRPEGTVELTDREAELLVYLAARPGEVVGRAELLREVWRVRPTTRTKALDMCVRRLRERIELDPDEPRHLLTVRGTGYRLLAGAPETIAPPAPSARRTELPPERGPLIGRAVELERLSGLLREGRRFVTVVGPAGVGKSRLVREWARRHGHSARVWLVDLGEERAADGMLRAVGRTLGIEGRDLGPDRIAGSLSARAQALVADAAEGCAEPLAELAERLLSLAPELTVLVTSRHPLHAPDEVVLRLEPLSNAELLELLRTRVELPPTSDADRLVVRLDGLPLAAELAAARLGLYSCAELADRLEQAGSKVLRASGTWRHASLHRALLDSWHALEPDDQRALAQLAVFRGGFTLDAARAVLDLPDPEDRVESLLDRSLLRSEPAPHGSARRRFRLFDSVRELAEELADPAEVERAVERHSAWFLAPMDPLWPPRLPLDEREDRWRDDPANLIAAVERAISRWPERALFGLVRLWALDTDVDTMEQLATRLAEVASPADRVHLELILGDVRICQVRPEEGKRHHRRSLEMARQSAPRMVPWVMDAVASGLASAGGDREQARRLHDEATEEARELGDLACRAYLLRRRGEIGLPGAGEALAEALALYRQLGDPLGELRTEIAIGNHEVRNARPAADAMARACARWTAVGRRRLPSTLLHVVAVAFYLEERPIESRAWTLAHLEQVERQGKRHATLAAYELFGTLELELGHLDAARATFGKLLGQLGPGTDARTVALRSTAHLGLGLVALVEGERQQARAHLRLASAHPEYAAITTGAWALAGGGEEARERLRASSGDPLVELGEALADLAHGTERFDQALARPAPLTPRLVAGRRLASLVRRISARTS